MEAASFNLPFNIIMKPISTSFHIFLLADGEFRSSLIVMKHLDNDELVGEESGDKIVISLSTVKNDSF